MKSNLFAFVENNIIFLIAEKPKLEIFNLMGNKQVRTVELLPEMEVREIQFTGSVNLKYIVFEDTLGDAYFWILEWPSEVDYEDIVFMFKKNTISDDTEPDCDNDGSNIINPDYSND